MATSEKYLQLIIDNFQLNFGQLSESAKTRLKSQSQGFWVRYILDFFVSSFIIAPLVISVWRGVWDHSLIYLEHNTFNDDCIQSNLVCLAIGLLGVSIIQYNHEYIRTVLGNFNPTSDPSSVRRTARFVFTSRIFR